MTIQQPIGKFVGSLFAGALVLGMAACSGSEKSEAPAGASGSTEVVGTFAIQMKVDKGMTSVVGQVADGPVPENLVWTEKAKEGDCRLETPKPPFCEEACGADVCGADGKCHPYPKGHSVGAVALTGVKLESGGAEIALKEIAASYQPPAGTVLAYPPFGAEDVIEIHAAGADYPAFDLSTTGVNPIILETTDFALSPDKPFVLEWDEAPDAKSSLMHVKIDLSHHGGVKGLIECDAADTGSLTISKEMIAELIGLGVAGFPSVVMTRISVDTHQLEHGKVQLEVSALVERYLTTPGVDSCTTAEDCPDGKTCASDATCQ
ncbi:MAG: hypothetical protein K0R38_5506 [Polyangiaceae bacterium]|jgi:hypothetical protein|nr:hypothetical protein [Polyangiaceae bacterium]